MRSVECGLKLARGLLSCWLGDQTTQGAVLGGVEQAVALRAEGDKGPGVILDRGLGNHVAAVDVPDPDRSR